MAKTRKGLMKRTSEVVALIAEGNENSQHETKVLNATGLVHEVQARTFGVNAASRLCGGDFGVAGIDFAGVEGGGRGAGG